MPESSTERKNKSTSEAATHVHSVLPSIDSNNKPEKALSSLQKKISDNTTTGAAIRAPMAQPATTEQVSSITQIGTKRKRDLASVESTDLAGDVDKSDQKVLKTETSIIGSINTTTIQMPITANLMKSDKSASLAVLEEALESPISNLFETKDGTPYGIALLDHFHRSQGPKDTEAFGFTYELFATMFRTVTLELLEADWGDVVGHYRITFSDRGVTTLPNTLSSSLAGFCRALARSVELSAEGYEEAIRSWNKCYELEMRMADLLRELEQFPTMAVKLAKIKQQAELLGIEIEGAELLLEGQEPTIASYVDHLWRGIAMRNGLTSTGGEIVHKQGLVAHHLIDVFGRGVLGVLALDGIKSIVQNLHAEAIPNLARFTKDETKVQTLFDHINTHLVEPVLSDQPVGQHGIQWLSGLLTQHGRSYSDEVDDEEDA